MKKYEIVSYEIFHTIDTEEKYYKQLLKLYINKYHIHFIKSIKTCKNFKQFLYKKYPNLIQHKLAELCYWFYNDLTDFPKCQNKKCNNHVTHFRSFTNGYLRSNTRIGYYCSSRCSNIGTKYERSITCIKNYNTPTPNQYNSKNILYRKYKQINVYKLFLSEEAKPLFSLDEYLNKNVSNLNRVSLLWKCTKCNKSFKAKPKFCNNIINGQVHHARCPYCYPLYNFSGRTTSIREKEVLKYIKSIYFGKILENDRTLMIPDKQYNNWLLNHELDIVLPDIKLAFEFNGSYWHNPDKFPETIIDDNEKLRQCNKLGFQLIFINEKLWLNNSFLVRSYISNIIKKTIKYQLYAISYKDIIVL